MARLVAYEAEGWGVGELWLDGPRVVWHELPQPGGATAVSPGRSALVERLQAYFAGEPIELDDVEVDLEYETEFLGRCARALRSVPRGQVVTYGELAAVARRAFSLLRALGIESEIRTYRRPAFDRATRFQLHVPGTAKTLRVLHEAGVLDVQRRPLERPPKRVVGRSCCRGAYLRGALLGGGSLSGPRDPHLEIRTRGVDGAEFVAAVAAKDGAPLRVADRGRFAVAY